MAAKNIPFGFVELPRGRSQKKPRRTWLAMMADFGLPLRYATDTIELAGPYIDLAKIAVGTSGRDLLQGRLRVSIGGGRRTHRQGKPKMKLINGIRRALDMSRVLIELPGAWISHVTLSAAEDMKKFLVAEFGPDVNIANVLPQDIIETEALRVGLGVVGPKIQGGKS